MADIMLVLHTLDGRECRVADLSLDSTCEELRAEAAGRLDMPRDSVQLVYGDAVLEDHCASLGEAGLSNGTELLCVWKFHCGPCGNKGCVFCNWGNKLSETQLQRRLKERREYENKTSDEIYKKSKRKVLGTRVFLGCKRDLPAHPDLQ
eukprot:TRINITY_DN103067_c0_g1_i1.p2 TRINITY_DN103067_c0_g1~~TRINITY_DN103067_c0_g1_i1.p2  ORF type:complete len:149 (+),score=37.26 TRINITY_DN103067_c0_g1_i1:88-534(+)